MTKTNSTAVLRQKSLVVAFAYAPAGLGHLRVSDALYRGLPKDVTPLLLGSWDQTIGYIHRIASIDPSARALMEWMQRGRPQELFTRLYRRYLRSRTWQLYQQMVSVLEQRIELPRVVLVVATHFGLAHQLAAVKRTLMEKKQVRVVLVVQVTDDSPQHIWYVPGADLLFVPSERTRSELLQYAEHEGLEPVRIEVAPYPVSPVLGEKLPLRRHQERLAQLDAASDAPIHVALPISGAAVGLGFFTELVDALHAASPRVQVHVISKVSSFTRWFLTRMMQRSFVDVHAFGQDREVVPAYEQLYRREVIGIEITKPSEQAFKALLTPEQVGGAVLLFCAPVGRQEYDNLDFLSRNQLVPHPDDRTLLWECAGAGRPIEGAERERILKNAAGWRGLELPADPMAAARFAGWCLENRIFAAMGRARRSRAPEVRSDGVRQFWDRVARFLAGEVYPPSGETLRYYARSRDG